jgi:hypothetical protein
MPGENRGSANGYRMAEAGIESPSATGSNLQYTITAREPSVASVQNPNGFSNRPSMKGDLSLSQSNKE